MILPPHPSDRARMLRGAGRLILIAAMIRGPVAAQSGGTATPGVLVYGTFEDALSIPGMDALDDGPRIGVVMTAYPSGWGLAYAHQRLTLEPMDPPAQDLVDEVHYRSILLVKEFHLRTPYLRPCVEVGASLVKCEYQVAQWTPSLVYGMRGSNPDSRVEHAVGVDIRLRALLSLSSRIGLQVALHSNINALHSYHSIDIGIAFGCVRPKLSNRVLPDER